LHQNGSSKGNKRYHQANMVSPALGKSGRRSQKGLRTAMVRDPAPKITANQAQLYTLGKFFRDRFGKRVQKISVDGGFTCPNIDGSKSRGGCTYCNNRSFSLGWGKRHLSIREQLQQQIACIRQKHPNYKYFLAYFQSYSNTYASLPQLQALYDEALSVSDIVGLDISTRPDCVPNPVLDLLQAYAQKNHLWLELGLESSHNSTLNRLNRGHTWAEFADAVQRASGRQLHLCVHVILGLPGETPEMMRETAKRLGDLVAPLDFAAFGIKLHHLHIVKGTILAKEYAAGKVETLTPAAYIPLVCDFLEYLPPYTVVQRFMGDALHNTLLAPHWQVSKNQVLAEIEAELARRGSGVGWRCGK
jgi:hypothetical protein